MKSSKVLIGWKLRIPLMIRQSGYCNQLTLEPDGHPIHKGCFQLEDEPHLKMIKSLFNRASIEKKGCSGYEVDMVNTHYLQRFHISKQVFTAFFL